MKIARSIAVFLILLGSLALFLSTTKDDVREWRPMICGFPGTGQSATKEFRLTRPSRYCLQASIPALYEPASNNTRYLYLDSEKNLECNLNLAIDNDSNPPIHLKKHIRSMWLGTVSDEFGYSADGCFFDLVPGNYKVTISSSSTVPLISSRGGFLQIVIAGKPIWMLDRFFYHGIGVLLIVVGLIAYAIFELKSP